MQYALVLLGAAYLLIVVVVLAMVLLNERNRTRASSPAPLPTGARLSTRPTPTRPHGTAPLTPLPTAPVLILNRPHTSTPLPTAPVLILNRPPTSTPLPTAPVLNRPHTSTPPALGCGVVDGNLACVADPGRRFQPCGSQQDCESYQQSKQLRAEQTMAQTPGERCFGVFGVPPVGPAQWTPDNNDASRSCHFDKVAASTYRNKACPKGTQPKFSQTPNQKTEKGCPGYHDKFTTTVQYACCDEKEAGNCLSRVHPVMVPVWAYDNVYAPEVGELVLGRGNIRNDCADGQNRDPCDNDVGKCQAWLDGVLNRVNQNTFRDP